MRFDVQLQVTISGIGPQIITVKGVDALDAGGAIRSASADLVTILAIGVVPSDSDPTSDITNAPVLKAVPAVEPVSLGVTPA